MREATFGGPTDLKAASLHSVSPLSTRQRVWPTRDEIGLSSRTPRRFRHFHLAGGEARRRVEPSFRLLREATFGGPIVRRPNDGASAEYAERALFAGRVNIQSVKLTLNLNRFKQIPST